MKRGFQGTISIGNVLKSLWTRNIKRRKTATEILYTLDLYDDIFSDFDPRPVSQRSISEDFIAEARKVIMDNDHADRITLRMFLSKKQRRAKVEETIARRLRNHFGTHQYILQKKSISALKEGMIYAIMGALFMLLATYIIHSTDAKNFLLTFLIILLEPAGWFLFWEGLYLVIFERRKMRPDIQFYQKLAQSKILFESKK